MNDPDRNTAPGLFFSPLKGLSKMRSSNYLVGSGFFKANYPFNYPFYFNNQDFVPAVWCKKKVIKWFILFSDFFDFESKASRKVGQLCLCITVVTFFVCCDRFDHPFFRSGSSLFSLYSNRPTLSALEDDSKVSWAASAGSISPDIIDSTETTGNKEERKIFLPKWLSLRSRSVNRRMCFLYGFDINRLFNLRTSRSIAFLDFHWAWNRKQNSLPIFDCIFA